MKSTTRKHIWPVSLVMAIAVVGMLAALVALSGGFTQPGGASAQGDPVSPFATPTGPVTPTMVPTRMVADSIKSSSTSANSTVRLELTIGNLPGNMLGGSSVELYLEDDFDVPTIIARDTVYFTVDNPPTNATGSGGRVYATDPIVVDTSDHFTADKDDYAIQVVLPDFNTADRPEFDGFNGPMQGQTLKMVFTKGAGIKNPSEEGSHSVGYAVLGPNDDANDGPQKVDADITGAPLRTEAKISLSDEDDKRGYNLVVTGSGFNNGTSAALHVLADPDTAADLKALVAGGTNDNNNNNVADEEEACGIIIRQGHRVGVTTVDSDDKASVEVEVTSPIFKPGNVNYLCMVDGEGRSSKTDVEDFELESSIRVSPTEATVGDTITVFAQDYPTTPGGFVELKIASQAVDSATVNLNAGSIGSDGSATATFTLPGSVSNSPLEGTVRIDAQWGNTSEDAKVTVTGSTLRLSQGEVRANESVTITGEGFGTGRGHVCAYDITIDGVQLEVDDDSVVTRSGCNPSSRGVITSSGDAVEVSNAGQFVVTVYLWKEESVAGSNPVLISGTHTIRVRDSAGYYGSVPIVIKEPSITSAPQTLGPRDYLTVTGVDWPVDNQDSQARIENVKVTIEGREYTVIPDGSGRFSVEHRVSRRVGIPSTNQIKAEYGSEIVKVSSFDVPAAKIEISPTQGQPGDEVSMSVEGMPVYTEVEEITIGGASVGGSLDLRTDRDGALTAEGVTIPGLDPGTYSVVMKVGSSGSETVAIGSIDVLPESDAEGAKAELPGALTELGDNLVAVFYFDNVSKEWSFFDPRPEFAELNTLDGLVSGQAYWVLVGEAVDEVVLNEKTRSLSCSNGDCWNLEVW